MIAHIFYIAIVFGLGYLYKKYQTAVNHFLIKKFKRK